MVEGLREYPDPDIRAWVEEKGEAHGERELKRIWSRLVADRTKARLAGLDDLAVRIGTGTFDNIEPEPAGEKPEPGRGNGQDREAETGKTDPSVEEPGDEGGKLDHPRLITVDGRDFERVGDDNLWRDIDGFELRIRDFSLGGADRSYEIRAPGGRHWWGHLGAAEQEFGAGSAEPGLGGNGDGALPPPPEPKPAPEPEPGPKPPPPPPLGNADTLPHIVPSRLSVLPAPWRTDLLVNKDGNPRVLLANAINTLRGAAEWQGLLWFDEFHNRVQLRGRPPWATNTLDAPWDDLFDILTTDWFHHQGIYLPRPTVGSAVWAVARERRFHPVNEYLETCRWDGEPRLDSWLVNYLGMPDTPFIYSSGRAALDDLRRRAGQAAGLQGGLHVGAGRPAGVLEVYRAAHPG
jgi:hypothetical protein